MMPRYIDADALGIRRANREIFDNKAYADGWNAAIDVINSQATADVQEVRHGKWVVKGLTPYCSVCHRPSEYECDGVHSKPLFCPNCGAKMDLGARMDLEERKK